MRGLRPVWLVALGATELRERPGRVRPVGPGPTRSRGVRGTTRGTDLCAQTVRVRGRRVIAVEAGHGPREPCGVAEASLSHACFKPFGEPVDLGRAGLDGSLQLVGVDLDGDGDLVGECVCLGGDLDSVADDAGEQAWVAGLGWLPRGPSRDRASSSRRPPHADRRSTSGGRSCVRRRAARILRRGTVTSRRTARHRTCSRRSRHRAGERTRTRRAQSSRRRAGRDRVRATPVVREVIVHGRRARFGVRRRAAVQELGGCRGPRAE